MKVRGLVVKVAVEAEAEVEAEGAPLCVFCIRWVCCIRWYCDMRARWYACISDSYRCLSLLNRVIALALSSRVATTIDRQRQAEVVWVVWVVGVVVRVLEVGVRGGRVWRELGASGRGRRWGQDQVRVRCKAVGRVTFPPFHASLSIVLICFPLHVGLAALVRSRFMFINAWYNDMA